jgi:fermentation-respiration switch protein FrsA (DUF1100 family)
MVLSPGLEATPTLGQQSWKRRIARQLRNLAFVYVAVLVVLLFLENKLIFRPVLASEDWLSPPNALVQDVELQTAEGTRLHGWWCPVPGWQPEQGAMLYCHGNAGNLSWRAGAIALWQKEMNQAIFIFDYPGYGRSAGRPSEAACYAAGDAAYDWLVHCKHVSPDHLLLYGKSLGGGVAVDLATRRPHQALILVKTFTSMPDEAQKVCPIMPARWLVRTRFDNLAKIKKCPRPVFVAHGTTDSLIPFAFGQRLFEAANSPKCFCSMEGVDHNDPLIPDFFASLRTFLAEKIANPTLARAAKD